MKYSDASAVTNSPLQPLAKFPQPLPTSRLCRNLAQRKQPHIANSFTISRNRNLLVGDYDTFKLFRCPSNRIQLARALFPPSLSRWALIFVSYNNRTFRALRNYYGTNVSISGPNIIQNSM